MAIHSRGILVHPQELTPRWLERMAAAGLNNLGLHPEGGAEAHITLQNAIDLHSSPERVELRKMAAALGINIEYEAHAMAWLVPRRLFGEHPEWFRMNADGERVADFNMCASDPAALKFLSERAALLASLLDTGSHKYYFWTDDVRGCSCHCPKCSGLTPSDQQLILVNAMLAGIKTYDPKAQLCYLAYRDALDAPRSVKPMEGVFLEYAPIDRDHHRPLNDTECEKNVRETAPLKALIDFFGADNARALDYWMDNSLFSGWKKPPKPFTLDEKTMRADVEYYRSLGFEDVTCFGCFLGPDFDKLYGAADLNAYGRILN